MVKTGEVNNEISYKSPLVSVGIPTYNRPDGLRRTIECITGQTYKNLEIIVSDNCSPGLETEAVVREFMEADKRIQYFRQDRNTGMVLNSLFVLDRAKSEYFMWAADDDKWDPDFIATLVRILENHPEIGLACTDAILIDKYGKRIYEYPNLHVLSGPSSYKTVIKYTIMAGVEGKALLLCGLFRKKILVDITRRFGKTIDNFGADVPLVLAAVIQGGVYIEPRIMFEKGVFFESNRIDEVKHIHFNKYLQRCPLNKFGEYFMVHISAARGTKYLWVVIICLIPELILSIVSFIIKIIISGLSKISKYLNSRFGNKQSE